MAAIPPVPVVIPDLVRDAVERFGSTEAVVDRGRRISYAELGADVTAAARALLANSVVPGDRVAIWAPNSYEWIVAALATGSVGAAIVPVNTRFVGEEAADILGRTRARILLLADGFLDKSYTEMLRSAASEQDGVPGSEPVPGLPHLERIIDVADDGARSWAQFLDSGSDVPMRDVEEAQRTVRSDQVLDIIFTSGTTGRPKGAMSSHRQTIDVAAAWGERAELTAEDRYLIVNPFFHTFGYKAGFVVALMNGATVLPQQVFDLDAVVDIIERERVTILPGPPTLYFSLLEYPQRSSRDLSSLRLAVTGTTVVPVPLIERMRSELSFSSILTAYGLSEAVVVTMCRRTDPPERISLTSGAPVAGFEVSVVDEARSSVPTGTPGEILLRGPNVMLGYFEDPEATAEAIDAEGWLHTGDVGHLDEAGYLTITDRIKDMFTVGGFNVYPAEVERTVMRVDAILECAVVGMPDDRMGEVGVAFVVARAGRQADPDAVIAFCREHLANYKVPRQVRVVDALPRNAGGKVLKTALRAEVR
jgi:HIP---CoA ligase